MPIYDYACVDCGTRVEVMHGVNDVGPTACAACGGPMRKLMSTPAIVFKGSGWAKKERATASAARAEKKPEGASADKAADGDSSGGTAKKVDAGTEKSKSDAAGSGTSATGSAGSDAS